MTGEAIAMQKIIELEPELRKLPCNPSGFSHIGLYQSIQNLYFAEKYALVIDLCDTLTKHM